MVKAAVAAVAEVVADLAAVVPITVSAAVVPITVSAAVVPIREHVHVLGVGERVLVLIVILKLVVFTFGEVIISGVGGVRGDGNSPEGL
jgi:hypothetical protein